MRGLAGVSNESSADEEVSIVIVSQSSMDELRKLLIDIRVVQLDYLQDLKVLNELVEDGIVNEHTELVRSVQSDELVDLSHCLGEGLDLRSSVP